MSKLTREQRIEKGKARKQQLCKKREKLILKLSNEKMENIYICLKKELRTIKKKKIKKSTIETKFDKFGNNISMLETSNKVDEEKVTKEKNISLSKDTTASYPSGIVETSDKNDISLMMEAEETTQNKSTGNLKYDTLFLLNYEIQSKNDELIEKNKVDGKYEKSVIQCDKGCSLIKRVVGRNITVL